MKNSIPDLQNVATSCDLNPWVTPYVTCAGAARHLPYEEQGWDQERNLERVS